MWRAFRHPGRLSAQILIVLAAVLVAARIALPHYVKKYVNDTLDRVPEYGGEVGDIDIHLWRGAYTIHDVDITKTDGDIPVPFFAAKAVDFSVEWAALFQGALVAKMKMRSPVINFVAGPSEEESQAGVDKPWLSVIKDLFPLNINRFEAVDGAVHYRDFHSRPKVDLSIDDLHVIATNLTNSSRLSKTLVANVEVTGRAFQAGRIGLKAKLDPRTEKPTFDFAGTMEPIALTNLNEFARAYGKFDFERGTIAIATELAAKDGRVTGYLKPVLDDIVIVDLREDAKNPLKLAWEGLIGGVTRIFRNQPKDRFATKIPIEGDLSDPKTPIFPTVGNLLKNAFVKAYQGDLDGTIEFKDAQRAAQGRNE